MRISEGVEAKRVAIGGMPKLMGQNQFYPNRSYFNEVMLNLVATPTSEITVGHEAWPKKWLFVGGGSSN